ncbi:hypothetical protein ACFZAM_31930 [Streptomyces sp. NPDC008079]|uniref:hypothetical protein n=1 Tax=Streptomyces sp. NPDC008079 TaxID=3364806 RepID=UPI0036E207C2
MNALPPRSVLLDTHDLVSEPPEVLSGVLRWRCTGCGHAVLAHRRGGLMDFVYGAATRIVCVARPDPPAPVADFVRKCFEGVWHGVIPPDDRPAS